MGRRTRYTLILLAALICVCIFFAAGCGVQPEAPLDDAETSAAETPKLTAEITPPVQEVEENVPDVDASEEPEQTPEPEISQAPEQTPEPTEEAGDVYTGPDLAERSPVDDEFFADAAFFGNSLVDGLGAFGGLEHGSFYAATSASVVNVDMTRNVKLENGEDATLLQALTDGQHGKIYILLGINEISFEPEYFTQLYSGLLDRIREYESEADIYIMSLTPVTEKCSESSEFFNMERIQLYNQALYQLAADKQCYYVDLCQALAGEDGYLAEEDATDGIHLKMSEYPRWAEYLRTHYAGKLAEET